jgi:peptidoglycan/xylan/chitin deacetylase (PgdA/CDA1 family)
MYVTPETFEEHLRFLTTHFELLGFQQLLTKWSVGDWDSSERYCAITFDDGWLDNYRYAYPLLRAYAAPATIFLPTDLVASGAWLWSDRLGNLLRRRGVGTPDDWDAMIEEAKPLPDAERTAMIDGIESAVGDQLPSGRRFVDWDEVRDMSRHGVGFASHTATHANLARLSGEALDRELREPLDALRREAVNHVPVLAYPNGDYTAAVADAARAAGYRAAVTVRRGLESGAPTDWFQLKRIAVHDEVSGTGPALALHIGRQGRFSTPIYKDARG